MPHQSTDNKLFKNLISIFKIYLELYYLNKILSLYRIYQRLVMGIGDWGLGIGPHPPSPNPKTQTPKHDFKLFKL